MKKILFLTAFICVLTACSNSHDKSMQVVTTCGDTLIIKAYALTAEEGEVWYRSSNGTGYIADVEYIIPLEDEEKEN